MAGKRRKRRGGGGGRWTVDMFGETGAETGPVPGTLQPAALPSGHAEAGAPTAPPEPAEPPESAGATDLLEPSESAGPLVSFEPSESAGPSVLPEQTDSAGPPVSAGEPESEESWDSVEGSSLAQPPAARMEPLARAKALVTEGRIEEAIAVYREIVADDPSSLKARNNLGLLYEGMGQHSRALEQLESARAIEPENVAVLSNLAGTLLSLGRFDDAEREIRRAMKLDMESVDVRANLGILYFRRGQYALAENELKWVCEQDEQNAHAFFYRGEALNRLGRVDKAIEVLERAALLQPYNAKIYHTMGILFDKKHMPAEAAQMYKKVRELSR